MFNNLAQIGARSRFWRTVGVIDVLFDTCDDFEVSVRSSPLVVFVSLLPGNRNNNKRNYVHVEAHAPITAYFKHFTNIRKMLSTKNWR